jgi:hypothetical protein
VRTAACRKVCSRPRRREVAYELRKGLADMVLACGILGDARPASWVTHGDTGFWGNVGGMRTQVPHLTSFVVRDTRIEMLDTRFAHRIILMCTACNTRYHHNLCCAER